MRSRPSRRGVPGANRARVSRILALASAVSITPLLSRLGSPQLDYVVMSTWTLPEGLEPVSRGPEAPAPGLELNPGWPRRFSHPGTDADLWGTRFFAGAGAAVTGQFEVLPELEGGPGVIHGGVMAAIFDELQGILGIVTQLIAVTAHLEIDYRKPIPVGSTVDLAAAVEGRTGRKLYTTASAHIDGELVASSQGIFVIIDPDAHYGEGASRTLGISP
ncbi:uncharacterized protein, possibly involved in aromatic compounds catabolism [Mycobacteroides abscessus subsp. massiliense]|nr:uncharacterized protein, possibly involved in aromatic compounds catabolism [Mycobacteroides abscessus subsp. massiliense]